MGAVKMGKARNWGIFMCALWIVGFMVRSRIVGDDLPITYWCKQPSFEKIDFIFKIPKTSWNNLTISLHTGCLRRTWKISTLLMATFRINWRTSAFSPKLCILQILLSSIQEKVCLNQWYSKWGSGLRVAILGLGGCERLGSTILESGTRLF